MVFGIMMCTTLNMDHRKLRTGLFQEIRKKIIDKHVKGKGYKTISKQLDIPVTTVAHTVLFRSLRSMGLWPQEEN